MIYKDGLVWFRTHFLQDVLQEQAKVIYYWRGKEIAKEHQMKQLETLQQFFEKMGLGVLQVEKKSKKKYRAKLTESPLAQFLPDHHEVLALEAGLIAGTIEGMEHQYAQGEYQLDFKGDAHSPTIEFIITLSTESFCL